MSPRSVAVLAVVIGLSVVASANAAVTSSNITAPANGSTYLTTEVNPAPSVPVTGTSNGTTGDFVDVRCYERADHWQTVQNNVAVAANGSFAAMMATDDPYGTCILRGVPHALAPAGDASPFTGPTLTGESNITYKVATGPNAGKVYDLYVLFQGTNAMNDYVSATDGGLWDSRLQYPNGYSSTYLWYENAALTGEEPSPAGRSFLKVDGRNAYGPRSARELFQDNPGLPQLTFDASRDPATGNTTIHDTEPIVVCPNETPFPPDAGACPQFNSAGVQLERTIFTDDGGLQVHITDTWRSTDGAAHTISPHYDQWVFGRTPQNVDVPVGLKLPWIGDFQTFTADTTFPGPALGAGSVFVRGNNGAPDGSETFPLGAVSFDVAPIEVRRVENREFTLRNENVSVPAGGTTVTREDFVMGQTQATVDAKAAANVDRFVAPTVSISSPANASTITGAAETKPITVTGSASDNGGIASLTLNGASVPLAADGTFSVPATVTLGANTLTAVAKDHAGNSTTATATATYIDNVAPAVTRFTATPSTFRVGSVATPITARAKAGTTFKFTLSENSTVSITIASPKPGKRSGKRCVKPTKKLRRAKSCQRLVSRGTLHRTLGAGERSVKFTGRIGKKKLSPGRYVATITAADKAGNKSKKKTINIRIVRR
jgi:Glucodextranase, domain B